MIIVAIVEVGCDNLLNSLKCRCLPLSYLLRLYYAQNISILERKRQAIATQFRTTSQLEEPKHTFHSLWLLPWFTEGQKQGAGMLLVPLGERTG